MNSCKKNSENKSKKSDIEEVSASPIKHGFIELNKDEIKKTPKLHFPQNDTSTFHLFTKNNRVFFNENTNELFVEKRELNKNEAKRSKSNFPFEGYGAYHLRIKGATECICSGVATKDCPIPFFIDDNCEYGRGGGILHEMIQHYIVRGGGYVILGGEYTIFEADDATLTIPKEVGDWIRYEDPTPEGWLKIII